MLQTYGWMLNCNWCSFVYLSRGASLPIEPKRFVPALSPGAGVVSMSETGSHLTAAVRRSDDNQ